MQTLCVNAKGSARSNKGQREAPALRIEVELLRKKHNPERARLNRDTPSSIFLCVFFMRACVGVDLWHMGALACQEPSSIALPP